MKLSHPETQNTTSQTTPFLNKCLLHVIPKPGLDDVVPACLPAINKTIFQTLAINATNIRQQKDIKKKKSVYVKVPSQTPSLQNKLLDKIAKIKFL